MSSIRTRFEYKILLLLNKLICFFSRRKTAFHEAGHALACYRFGIPFNEVSIILQFSEGIFDCGHVSPPQNVHVGPKEGETLEQRFKRKNEFLKVCIIMEFCGEIAEEKFSGKSRKKNDHYHLENINDYLSQMRIPKEDEKKVVEQCRILAKQFVNCNWDDISLIAKALLKSPSHGLNDDEFRKLIEND